jgi:hypothetical protein
VKGVLFRLRGGGGRSAIANRVAYITNSKHIGTMSVMENHLLVLFIRKPQRPCLDSDSGMKETRVKRCECEAVRRLQLVSESKVLY